MGSNQMFSCLLFIAAHQKLRYSWGKGRADSLRCDERTNPSSEEELILHFFFLPAYFTVNKELRKIAENVSIQAAAEFPANCFGMAKEEGKCWDITITSKWCDW